MVNLSTALKTAIEMEKKAHDLYIGASKKTMNKLGKETLEAIAAKELDHIAAINKFSEKMSGDKNYEEAVLEIKPKSKEDYILPIVEKLTKELDAKIKPDSDLEKAYAVAIGMEKESYDLYKRLAGESKDPDVKKFFEFLMGEENTHYELFRETLEYLNRPWDWFKEQERWIVEG